MTNPNRQRLKVPALLGVLLLAGFGMVYLTGSFAQTTNGYNGFPLDDPWIHLQFAKNVVEYGSFSYYEDQLVTAGSTSPLYTLLLAAGMLVTRDEMLLSYTLGTIFFLIGGWFFFALIRRQFGEQLLVAVLAVFLFLMEPRLQWVTLSGMETTLFISNVLAAVYFYYVRKPVAFGIVSGLLMWSRPEGLLMLMVFGADFFYHHVIVRDAASSADPPLSRLRRSWVLRALPILAALVFAYGAFNLALSGTFLPNTYAAKLKYYAAGGEGFLLQVFHFLSDGHMVIPALFALIGTMSVLLKTIRREENPFLIPLLWAGGVVVAYWWKLPYLYHNGRYLMPILPFVLIIAFHGISVIADLSRKIARTISRETIERTLQAGMLGIAAIQFVIGSWTGRDVYADYCRYIHDRQVTTAFWIRDHLPEDAVVATHDIGAVAYYSERRIVDMVGLVSPEIISRIGEREALLGHLSRSGATHLVVLRSWFDIDNINPLFQTDEMRPEVMEVFRYEPERMHFVEG